MILLLGFTIKFHLLAARKHLYQLAGSIDGLAAHLTRCAARIFFTEIPCKVGYFSFSEYFLFFLAKIWEVYNAANVRPSSTLGILFESRRRTLAGNIFFN